MSSQGNLSDDSNGPTIIDQDETSDLLAHVELSMTDSDMGAGPSESCNQIKMENGKSTQDTTMGHEKSGPEPSDSEEAVETETEGRDSEDDDEYDDDDEPVLKYERIGGELSNLLGKDPASALAISNKLLVNLHCVLQTFHTAATNFCEIGTGHSSWPCIHFESHRTSHQVVRATPGVRERHCYGRNGRLCGHCFP